MVDQNFPPGSPDSSKPILPLNVDTGPKGDPGRMLVAHPPFIGIPCDSDDGNPVYTNAESFFYIIEGSLILALFGSVDGWTIEAVEENDCTTTVAGFRIDVDTISADTASFRVRAYKGGEADLFAWVYLKRINKGVQGDQGIQGNAGPTGGDGPTGASGSDGTGMVVVKHAIEVKSSKTSAITDYGDGKINLDFGATPHAWVLGEWLLVEGGGAYGDFEAEIIEVVDTYNVKIDYTYGADEAGNSTYSMRHFRTKADDVPQRLRFDKAFGVGDKPYELWFIMDSLGGSGVTLSCGYAIEPAAGYNYYLNSQVFGYAGANRAWDWLDTLKAQRLPLITPGDSRAPVYLYGVPYPDELWVGVLIGMTLELHILYTHSDIDFP